MRIPYQWHHFRYIDWHQSTDWAVGFISLSPYNEAFIWKALNISPRTNKTFDIARQIAEASGLYKFKMDKIDPLANIQQTNTTKTSIEDLNHYFHEFKKEGLCTGAFWTSADTKSERGREKIKERLINSNKCGRPFNNEVIRDGERIHLPTLWVFSDCKIASLSLKNWREEKGKPDTRSQYSHHCTGIEFLMKDRGFCPPSIEYAKQYERTKIRYFQKQ